MKVAAAGGLPKAAATGKRMVMDEGDYRQGLLDAYRGERSAAITFIQLLDRLELRDEERSALRLLAAVETVIGDRLEPLVLRHGLPAALDQPARDRALARAGNYAGWEAVVASMGDRLLPVLAGFEALRAAAPPEDEAALDLLAGHERALLRFGAAARAGNLSAAVQYLLPFLPQGRGEGRFEPID